MSSAAVAVKEMLIKNKIPYFLKAYRSGDDFTCMKNSDKEVQQLAGLFRSAMLLLPAVAWLEHWTTGKWARLQVRNFSQLQPRRQDFDMYSWYS